MKRALGAQITYLLLLLRPSFVAAVRSPEPPAASDHLMQKSRPAAPLALPSAHLPRYEPLLFLFLLPVLHIWVLQMLLFAASAAPCGPPSHLPSVASAPSAHTQRAPCTSATGPINACTTLPLPVFLSRYCFFPLPREPSSTRPSASRLPRLPAPRLLLPRLAHAPSSVL